MEQKDAGTAANALVLTVVGLAKTRVMYKATGIVPTTSGVAPYTHRDNYNEDIEFLSYDVQLASFNGKASSGVHSFPFSVVLPPDLPPSMKVSHFAVPRELHTPPGACLVSSAPLWAYHDFLWSRVDVLHVLCMVRFTSHLLCAPVRNHPFSFQETGGGGSMAIAYGFRARLQRPGTGSIRLPSAVEAEQTAEGVAWLVVMPEASSEDVMLVSFAPC